MLVQPGASKTLQPPQPPASVQASVSFDSATAAIVSFFELFRVIIKYDHYVDTSLSARAPENTSHTVVPADWPERQVCDGLFGTERVGSGESNG